MRMVAFLAMLASITMYNMIDALQHQHTARVQGCRRSCRSLVFSRITTRNTGYRNQSPLTADISSLQSALQSSLKGDISEVSLTKKPLNEKTAPVKFDISLAVILAGYSFEAYNEPVRVNYCECDISL